MKKDSNFILKITLLAGHHRGARNILYAPWLGFCVGSPMQSVTGREDTESVGQIYFSVGSLPAPALDPTTFARLRQCSPICCAEKRAASISGCVENKQIMEIAVTPRNIYV